MMWSSELSRRLLEVILPVADHWPLARVTRKASMGSALSGVYQAPGRVSRC